MDLHPSTQASARTGSMPGIEHLLTAVPGKWGPRPRNRPVLWMDQVEGEAGLDVGHRIGVS